jgi:hypothetical protein
MREDPTFDTIRMLNGFKPFLHHHYSRINTSCGDEDFGMIVAEFSPRNPEVEYYRMSFSSVMRLGCWLARREILFRDFNELRRSLYIGQFKIDVINLMKDTLVLRTYSPTKRMYGGLKGENS